MGSTGKTGATGATGATGPVIQGNSDNDMLFWDNTNNVWTVAQLTSESQNIAGSSLTGSELTIGISGGNSETIDISSLLVCDVDISDDFESVSGTLPSSWTGSSSGVSMETESPGGVSNKFIKIWTANQWLKTPSYDLSRCSKLRFGFNYINSWGNIGAESGDDLKIYISSDDGQTWSQVGNTLLGSTTVSSWTSSPTYQISSGLTSTVKIKFETTCSEFLDAWYIDDFYLQSSNDDYDWIVSGNDIYTGYTGNVGIGTSSPSQKLDIVGNIEVSGTVDGYDVSTIGQYSINSAGTSGQIWKSDGSGAGVWSNISSIESDPQVGTNTTDYLSKWDGSKLVKSSILEHSNNRLKIESDYGYTIIGMANSSFSHFYTEADKYYFDKKIVVDGGKISSYNENLQLQTQESTRLTILNSSGNVGIGETNPAAKLEVAGASIIGWNGNPDYMYISPFELKPTNDNGNWEFTNSDGGNANTSSSDWSYGGQVRYYYGSDGYFSFFIPYGYKMTGYDFYFGNYPSDIKVYTSGISGYGVTLKDTYDPGSGYGTATQSEDNNTFNSINSSSSYIIIHFINDPTDQFFFKGGRIRIARQ